jgi:hypothetical protein
MTADGILGQVKINTNITCSADYTNGIRGYLELVGGNTVNTGGANANIGAGGHAVHGWISAAGNLTIASGHYLCGVASRLSVDATFAITTTGVLAAYGVFADNNLGGATPTQAWQYGLYMDPVSVGKILYAGVSGNPVTNDTASTKFISLYTDCGATSGTSVGLYLREYITGAGGSAAVARIYGDVVGVTAATVHGIQVSVGNGESTTAGSFTGAANAIYAQIGVANNSGLGGTLTPICSEIYSWGSNSVVTAAATSMFRVSNAGNSTGMANVDDYANLFQFDGFTVGDGNMIAIDNSPAAINITHSFRCRLPNGSLVYLYGGASPVTA